MCNASNEGECAELKLLGAPKWELAQLRRNIGPSTKLFLVNFDNKNVIGPFTAVEPPGEDLVAAAFGGKCRSQVRVAAAEGGPLRMGQLLQRMGAGPKSSSAVATIEATLSDAEAEVQAAWGATAYTKTAASLGAHAKAAMGPRPPGSPAPLGAGLRPSAKAFTPPFGRSPSGLSPGLGSPPAQASASSATPATPGEERTGFIFHCERDSQAACETHRVLAGPHSSFVQMQQQINAGTVLFLLNRDTQMLMGTFAATEDPKTNAVPGFCGGRFPAQVKVKPMGEIKAYKVGLSMRFGPMSATETESLVRKLRKSKAAEPKVQVAWNPCTWTLDGRPVDPEEEPAGKRARAGALLRQPSSTGEPVDAEGRKYDLQSVIVNFANVGATYAKKVLKRDKEKGDRLFDWEGVRRCVTYMKQDMGMNVVGCVFENYSGPDNGVMVHDVPEDIAKMCTSVEETPDIRQRSQRIGGQIVHKSADDEMTIKLAHRRNCRFLDNDNYRDWLKELRNVKSRAWLQNCQDLMQMKYYFDSHLGTFDTLDGNVPLALLAPRTEEDR